MASLNTSKQLKEEFVSNLTGSSFSKIWALLSIVPISMVLRHLTSSFRPIDCYATDKSLKKNDNLIVAPKNFGAYFATLIVDFLFILIPMTLFFTILADWAYLGSFLGFMLFFCNGSSQKIWFASRFGTQNPFY